MRHTGLNGMKRKENSTKLWKTNRKGSDTFAIFKDKNILSARKSFYG